MADIFISHASQDAPLVEALVQLIEGGIGIRSDQIFCTSLEEQGVPPGVDFKSHIKQQLGDAKTVIALVSPQYYASAFCMCELGATWALAKTFLPLLVPPVDYQNLRGSLFGTQALPINNPEKLDIVQSEIMKLATHPEKVVRWNSRKAQFLDKLPEILKRLKPVTILSEKEAEKLKADLKEYKQEFEKADKQIAVLKEQINDLSRAKDSDEVEEIKKKYSTGLKQFEELVRTARRYTGALPPVVREALFYYFRNGEFLPDYDDWGDQPRDAEENQLLIRDENVFSANEDHPKVKKAIKALRSLRDFLKEPPEDFSGEEYERKYADILDMKNRSFWEHQGLL